MDIRDIKGLLFITMAVDSEDNTRLGTLKDSEIMEMAKHAVGNLISEALIRDILIGHDGDKMQIAVSI